MSKTTTEAEQAMPGAALERTEDLPGLDRLKRKPIIDTIEPRTLALIQSTIAPNCTPAEVGHFLELCAHYGLDPFAKEAWCAKAKKDGKLLIMVGRDGLRKIGQRNGLHIDGDVVRAKDEFTICRTPDGNRTVTHSYGNPAQRGDVIGAWAECRMGGPLGKPMGYFYAPLSEYMPKGASDYSPWSKQVGVMILAAAERQAIRQATPLSGLLAIGEDEVINGNAAGLGSGQGDGQPVGLALGDEVDAVIARAEQLGHAGLADRATVEMLLDGQPLERVAQWVKDATAELDDVPLDAEVVPDAQEAAVRPNVAQAGEGKGEATDAPHAPPEAAQTAENDPERIEAMRRRALALLDDADAFDATGDEARASDARGEAESLMALVDAACDPSQESLGF